MDGIEEKEKEKEKEKEVSAGDESGIQQNN